MAEAMERFFDQIRESGALPEGTSAEDAATATLCVLSRRISTGEAARVLGTLPGELRTRFRVCMLHLDEPHESFEKKRFVRLVAEHLDIDEAQAEPVARAVFDAVHTQFGNPELDALEGSLPKDLKDVFHGTVKRPRVGAPPGVAAQTAGMAPHQTAQQDTTPPDDREKRPGRTSGERRPPPEVTRD